MVQSSQLHPGFTVSNRQAVSHLKEHGFRVEAHAIGDRAASELIDVFEKLMPSSERPVLTHCQ